MSDPFPRTLTLSTGNLAGHRESILIQRWEDGAVTISHRSGDESWGPVVMVSSQALRDFLA